LPCVLGESAVLLERSAVPRCVAAREVAPHAGIYAMRMRADGAPIQRYTIASIAAIENDAKARSNGLTSAFA
jgi:hypothetical protein